MSLKNVLWIFLSVILGLSFVVSALFKLSPIEYFELQFVDLGLAGWGMAPFIARLVIALELWIGVLLVFNIRVRWFARASLWLLFLFCAYLVFLITTQGDKGNCGCLGLQVEMTPSQALVKNAVLIVLSILLLKYYPEKNWRYGKIFSLIAIPLSVAAPFILNPPGYTSDALSDSEIIGKKLLLELVYDNPEHEQPAMNLRQGNYVVAFMSLKCKHCKVAAYKLSIIKEKYPELNAFFFLNGKEHLLQPFLDETHSENIPHSILLGSDFVTLGGVTLPIIYHIQDGVVMERIRYETLDESDVARWFAP